MLSNLRFVFSMFEWRACAKFIVWINTETFNNKKICGSHPTGASAILARRSGKSLNVSRCWPLLLQAERIEKLFIHLDRLITPRKSLVCHFFSAKMSIAECGLCLKRTNKKNYRVLQLANKKHTYIRPPRGCLRWIQELHCIGMAMNVQ